MDPRARLVPQLPSPCSRAQVPKDLHAVPGVSGPSSRRPGPCLCFSVKSLCSECAGSQLQVGLGGRNPVGAGHSLAPSWSVPVLSSCHHLLTILPVWSKHKVTCALSQCNLCHLGPWHRGTASLVFKHFYICVTAHEYFITSFRYFRRHSTFFLKKDKIVFLLHFSC